MILLDESGSLIRAAKEDTGRQSRLSHHLRELSAFFGAELTQRAGKSIRLTPAGKELARMVREHFLGLQAFRSETAGVIPAFRIGAGDSLMQWLVVRAIARIRRGRTPVCMTLHNLRTTAIVDQLNDRKVELGVLRADAVEEPLKQIWICDQRYAIFVPRRLVPSRGLLTVREALLKCPHAAIAGDGQLMDRVMALGRNAGGSFVPELTCDSIGQCVAAVRTGAFAAVLPVQAWPTASENEYIVVEDESLDVLGRRIVLAWHPRMLEVIGESAEKMQRSLAEALKEVGAGL